jgi:hypothetical protein
MPAGVYPRVGGDGHDRNAPLAFSAYKIPLLSPFIKGEASVALALPLFLKKGQGGCPTTATDPLAKGQPMIPFMVRYPFDLLRAVSQVEPLTTNGKSKS